MGAVTYFVRMVAKEGKAEEVQQLQVLGLPRRAPAAASAPPRES
jgi:hypothetical protein